MFNMKRMVKEIKSLSIKDYLDEIKPYLKDVVNNLKKPKTWKIQLTIAFDFVSSKDIDDERVMHSKSGNIEIMIYDKEDKVIHELFESLLRRYQIGLERSMKGNIFIFDSVNLFNCINEFSESQSNDFNCSVLCVKIMCYMLKNKHLSHLYFKTKLKSGKTNHSFNDSQRRRMTFYCSKNAISVIRRNNFKNKSEFCCLNCHI